MTQPGTLDAVLWSIIERGLVQRIDHLKELTKTVEVKLWLRRKE